MNHVTILFLGQLNLIPFCIENIRYILLMQGIRLIFVLEISRIEGVQDILIVNQMKKVGMGKMDGYYIVYIENLIAYSKEINIPMSDLAIAYPLHKNDINCCWCYEISTNFIKCQRQ